jgi:hypothetical protein
VVGSRFVSFSLLLVFTSLLFAGCASQPAVQATPVPQVTVPPVATPAPVATATPAPTPIGVPTVTPVPAPSVPPIVEVKAAVEREINSLFPQAGFSLIELSYNVGAAVVQERKYYEKEASFSSASPSGDSMPVRLTVRLQSIYPGEPFDKGYSPSSTATVAGRQMDYEEGNIDSKSSITCYGSTYGITFSIAAISKVWDSASGAWKKVDAKDLYSALAKACPK